MSSGGIADPARLSAVRETGLFGSSPEPALARVARLLARVLAVPTTAVALAGERAHFLQAARGMPEPWASTRELPLELALCTPVVEHGETLVVADARADRRFAGHAGLDAVGVGAYLGAPLHAGGHVVGTLCALDTRPHAWTPDDVAALHDLAACIDDELELRAALRARDVSAERHRAIVETAVDGILTIDDRGRIISFNAAAERLFGYREDEVVGRSVGMLMPPDARAWHEDSLRRYRAGEPPTIIGTGREVLAQHRDGTRFSVQLSVGEMHLDGQRMFTGVIHDTSARRRAEESTRRVLAEQEALRRVAEAVAERRATAEIFALAVSEVTALLAVESAALIRFDADDAATIVGWHGTPGLAPMDVGRRLDAGDLSGSAVMRHSGTSVRGGALPRRLDGSEEAVLVEHVVTPVVVGSSIWGSLAAATTRVGGIPDDAEERLERFASLVGLAIDKAVAHDALHVRALQGSVVSRISKLALRGASLDDLFAAAVKALRDVLGTDRTAVTQIVGDRLVMRCSTWTGPPTVLAADGTSVSAAAIRADRPVLVRDRQAGDHEPLDGALAGLRATLAGVIRLGGRPWGTLTGASRDATSTFDEVDLHFVTAVANALSAALERMRAEEEIRHHALHDPLTGLANRTLLADRLAISLGRGRESGRKVCVLFVDVDHFKAVNDAHGRTVGDDLLVATAERLNALKRPGDTVARLGGDEFVVVADVADELAASALAARVAAALDEPIVLDGTALQTTVSIGVAISTPDADVDGMLRDADIAMYRAKALGRARTELFDDTMRERLVARVRAANELSRALDDDELVLHYQPIVSLHDGDVVSVEALVRWQHPTQGLVGPESFVDVAEESGTILALGRHVIRSACHDAAHWNRVHPERPPMGVSVNLSPLQLNDSRLVEHVCESLAAYRLSPSQLCFEITETVLLDGDPTKMARLAELRAMGVRFLLDDFGTGYASLAYLQRIELHAIKLDRTFVAGLGVNVRDTAIVTAVTQMARGLGLQLVAEGIETRAQVAGLQALGCPLGQGFLFARPQTVAGIDALLVAAPSWRRAA